MTLRPIPVEQTPKKKNAERLFNPGNKIKKNHADFSLKHLCLSLVHFINRGSRFTYSQVDELIGGLYRLILHLQRKKQDILKKKQK